MAQGLEDLAPAGLLDRMRNAAALVESASRVRIFCHYDPDGTTSAAILARAMMRRGKRIHASMAHALDRAAAARLREVAHELVIVGEMGSGPLGVCLDPYFRGLSGRPDAAAAFLQTAGFDPEATIRQLETTGRRKLASVLAVRLVEQGATPEALDVLVADRFWIEPDQMYAQALEPYVYSGDRLGQKGLGVGVGLGVGEGHRNAGNPRAEHTQ